VRQASLAGVACPALNSCIAVGEATDLHGRGVPLSEVWDGSGWSVVRAPAPEGARTAQFFGIACLAVNACTAVGSSTLGTLVETWDGSTWSIVPTPNPRGRGSSVLRGIACTEHSKCVAVGDHGIREPGHRAIRPLIERWNGTEWSIETGAAGGSSLTSVACPADDTCMAVGRGNGTAFAEAWDRSGWRATDARTRAALSGVACPSATGCYAVGSRFLSKPPVIEHWDGSAWKVMPVDWPANLFPMRLDAIECSSSDKCLAVGFGSRFFHRELGTLVARWNCSAWSVPRTPALPHATVDELEAVACSSASTCAAVGYGQARRMGTIKALALAWNGSQWSSTTPINPRGAEGAGLNGVSCPSATFCMAVGLEWPTGLPGEAGASSAMPGSRQNPNGQQMSRALFSERWDGKRWSLVAMPIPPGLDEAFPNSVSCTSPSFCMAAGAGGTRSILTGVTEIWNGHVWTSLETPNPKGQSELLAVSCASASDCVAVGDDGSFFNNLFTLAEHWNGRKWSEMETPTPAVFSSLASVSCSARDACTAAGWAQPGPLPTRPVAERWDGTAWKVQKTPTADGSDGAVFTGISCPETNRCVGVGSSLTDQGSDALAEIWNGRSWRLAEIPTGSHDALYAVDCPADGRCVAVGARADAALADVWSNGDWSAARVKGSTDSAALVAISCPGVDVCTAAGEWFDGSFANTLVMAYRVG
jgi:hypothetical protein